MYMDKTDRQFGAWRLNDQANTSKVKFSIFIPDRGKDPTQYEEVRQGVADFGDPKIQSISVAGTFQESLGRPNWIPDAMMAMNRQDHQKGFIWSYTTASELTAGFYEYKYFVTFENGESRWVGDPCSRYGGQDVSNQNAGFVVGPSAVDSTNAIRNGRKPLRDLMVYELNIDDFTDEFRYSDENIGHRSALDAAGQKLDHLSKLGINAILFMPWTAWANDLFSWGYTPYQYFSVEHRYTNDVTDPSQTKQLSRLRELINACHDRDIHVIMDGVFNHVGADNTANFSGFPYRWLYLNPAACPYAGTFGGTFPGLQDLDYHNGCTQEFIRDVCFYWMDEFSIDGIRFDNTTNFYIEGDQRGLPMLLSDIHDHANDPNFSLTLEHLDMSAAKVTNTTRATSYWNNALYQRSFDYLWSRGIGTGIMAALDNHRGLNPDKVATVYLSNHDHSHVAWQAGARDNQGSMQWYLTQPYVIALFTAPGVPLIQNGQEFAEDHWITEDDHGSGRRVQTRPLRWEFVTDSIGRPVLDLYRKLVRIRSTYAALRSDNFYPGGWDDQRSEFNEQGYGISVSRQAVIFHRWGTDAAFTQRFIVVLNFSQQNQALDIPFPVNGTWKDLLTDAEVEVSDFWLRNRTIGSNWGSVFFRQD